MQRPCLARRPSHLPRLTLVEDRELPTSRRRPAPTPTSLATQSTSNVLSTDCPILSSPTLEGHCTSRSSSPTSCFGIFLSSTERRMAHRPPRHHRPGTKKRTRSEKSPTMLPPSTRPPSLMSTRLSSHRERPKRVTMPRLPERKRPRPPREEGHLQATLGPTLT